MENIIYIITFLYLYIETVLGIVPAGEIALITRGALMALSMGGLNNDTLIAIMWMAVILGDTSNFLFGKKVGGYVSKKNWLSKFISQNLLHKLEGYFHQYAGKVVVIGRFIPFVRSITPLMAGAGKMSYSKFLMYSVTGGLLWILVWSGIGQLFVNLILGIFGWSQLLF